MPDWQAMERRWFNPSQPQTLQIAVWLLYFNAFWALVGLLTGGLISLLLLAANAGAAYGIANERKWAYGLGIAVAGLEVLFILSFAGGITGLLRGAGLISFAFAVALLALLVHPMSRDYQRIWFR